MENLDKALLTGAGFTANFGGYLASQMTSRVLGCANLSDQHEIVEHLITVEDLDYESIYFEVSQKPDRFPIEARRTIQKAVEAAYIELDNVVRDVKLKIIAGDCCNLGQLKTLINCFSGDRQAGTRGHFFTLNQDVFVERWLAGDTQLAIPGFDHSVSTGKGAWALPPTDQHPKIPEDLTNLKKKDQNLSASSHFQYLKLHGSFDWRTPEGEAAAIIGRGKLEQVEKFPLLKFYYEKFQTVLSGCNRLLVIGYGFGDRHINSVIANAKLKCYVMYPHSLGHLKDKILKDPDHGKEIFKQLLAAEHFVGDLKHFFPPNHDTSEGKKLIRIFAN